MKLTLLLALCPALALTAPQIDGWSGSDNAPYEPAPPTYQPSYQYPPPSPPYYGNPPHNDDYDHHHPRPRFQLRCPVLKCQELRNVGPLSFQQVGPSIQAVCVYGKENFDTCSLSTTGSFCRLNNRFYGPDEVFIDEDGQGQIKCRSPY